MFKKLPAVLVGFASVVAGCSIHPIPGDVSPYSTFEIVRNVRCEAKFAVRDRIQAALDRYPELAGIPAEEVVEPKYLPHIKRLAPELAATFQNYNNSSIAYNFEFSIQEDNQKSAGVHLQLPFLSGGGVDANAGGSITKQRVGERKFNTLETFGELTKLDCSEYVRPRKNILYPMTGSIGIAKTMNTFIDLAELGGAKEQFVDTIRFETRLSAGADATLRLQPVIGRMRALRTELRASAGRIDVHKLVVSLAFPTNDLRGRASDGASARATSKNRALINLCIARAESREDFAGALRSIPPQIYCRRQSAPGLYRGE